VHGGRVDPENPFAARRVPGPSIDAAHRETAARNAD
jgi:hypothetical protein